MSVTSFLQYLEIEKNYSPRTLQSYKTDLEEFTRFLQSEYTDGNPSVAKRNDLRNFLMGLSKKGLSERTINRKISSLKSYYKFLLKIGQIESSPAAGIKTLKQYNKVRLPFSEEELQLLFATEGLFPDNYSGRRDRLIIELLYATGMRRAELIGLKVSDVDFSMKNIRVLGKRNKERLIPLSDSLLSVLREYLTIRERFMTETIRESAAGEGAPESDFTSALFLTEKAKPLYDKFVYKLVNSYLGHTSTKEKRSPHILRHSFATHLLDHGADLNSVKELLGHTSLAATQVYTHGSIEQLKKVFNKTHPREQKNQKL